MSTWEGNLPDGQYQPVTEGIEVHKARLKGATDALSAATRSGEDIALDKDAAHAVLAKAEEILDRLTDQKSRAMALQQMKPPSDDMASQAYNKLATNGATPGFFEALSPFARAFDNGVSEIDGQVKYLKTFIKSLRKALGLTVADDEDAATTVGKAGAPASNDGGYF
ncbi:hypothetical protein [Amycolatopsis sp. NPDC004378]